MNQIIMFGLNNIVYQVMERDLKLQDMLKFLLIGFILGNLKRRACQFLDFTIFIKPVVSNNLYGIAEHNRPLVGMVNGPIRLCDDVHFHAPG